MGSGTREETREAPVFSLFPSFPAHFLFFDYCYFYWDTQRGAFAEERAMKPWFLSLCTAVPSTFTIFSLGQRQRWGWGGGGGWGDCFIVRCHVTFKTLMTAHAARVKFQLQLYKTITQNHSISFWPFSSPQGEYQLRQQDFIPSSYAFSFHGVYRLAKITLNWIGPAHSFKHYFSYSSW